MRLVMDSDVLIKITKASVKDIIASNFEVYMPSEVKNEAVDEGKVGGYADALAIEENITKGKLRVAETKRAGTTERLIADLKLLGGEAGSVRLFRQGGYEAVATDDSKFIDLLESLRIPYMTPAALFIHLLRRKRISKSEALQHLDKVKGFISPDEYLASIEALRQEN